jgi:hypothetical protein
VARRGGRRTNWVVAVAALGLLVAAGFAAVRLVDGGSDIAESLSSTGRGRDAAAGVRTVLASDDLALPDAPTREFTIECTPGADSQGPPGLWIAYNNVEPAEIRERLTDRGWERQKEPFALYQKQFGNWLATILIATPTPDSTDVNLTVGDYLLHVDCLAFRDGLRRTVTTAD